MDLLQCGIIHLHVLWNTHLRGSIHGLAESSGLRGSSVAKAREPGLLGWNFWILGQKYPELPKIGVQ